MKNFYEIVTIFSPNTDEQKLQEYIKKIKSIISLCEGNIIKEENWGNKKLAYEIKKFSSGIYHFIFCEANKSSLPSELKKFFSMTENVIRYGIKKIVQKKQKIASSIDDTRVDPLEYTHKQ